MPRSSLAPLTAEDELADRAVRRGRNAGGTWIVAAIVTFGIGLTARTPGGFVLAWFLGLMLFALGLLVRARYWAAVRRELGDATIQRALWRSADAEQFGSGRIIGALALVVVLLAFELWRSR